MIRSKLGKFLLIFGAIFLAFFVLSVVFYKTISQKITETFLSEVSKGQVSLNEAEDQVTFKNDEGEVVFQEGGELPPEFPRDFPIYPEAKLINSWLAEDEAKKAISIVWESDKEAGEIASFFEKELPKAGWATTSDFAAENSIIFSFERDKTTGFLAIGESESKTAISATITLE